MVFTVYTPLEGQGQLLTATLVTGFTEYISYDHHKYWQKPGNFTLTVPAYANGIGEVKKDMLLYVDEGAYGTVNDCLIITTVLHGESTVTLSGTDLKGLLSYRVTMFPQEETDKGTYGHDARKGSTGSIIKGYIEYNCVQPTDENRIIPGLRVESAYGGLSDDSYMTRLQPLNEVVTAICENADVGWDITFSPSAVEEGYAFNLVEGTDRTNASGASKCVFADFLQNTENAQRQSSASERRNVIWVVNGSGTDDAVVTSVYKTDIEEERKGFLRREAVLTANCDADLVQEYVNSNTADMTDKEQLSFVLTDASMYGKAFFCGDIVTLMQGGAAYDKRVTGVAKNYSAGRHEISVELGDIPLKKVFEKTRTSLAAHSDGIKEIELEIAGVKSTIPPAVKVPELIVAVEPETDDYGISGAKNGDFLAIRKTAGEDDYYALLICGEDGKWTPCAAPEFYPGGTGASASPEASHEVIYRLDHERDYPITTIYEIGENGRLTKLYPEDASETPISGRSVYVIERDDSETSLYSEGDRWIQIDSEDDRNALTLNEFISGAWKWRCNFPQPPEPERFPELYSCASVPQSDKYEYDVHENDFWARVDGDKTKILSAVYRCTGITEHEEEETEYEWTPEFYISGGGGGSGDGGVGEWLDEDHTCERFNDYRSNGSYYKYDHIEGSANVIIAPTEMFEATGCNHAQGQGNMMYNVYACFIAGANNKLGVPGSTAGLSSDSFVCGYNNTADNVSHSLVSGSGNRLTGSYGCTVVGSGNKVTGSSSSFVSGDNNTVTSGTSAFVSGGANTVSGNDVGCVGHGHSVSGEDGAFACGGYAVIDGGAVKFAVGNSNSSDPGNAFYVRSDGTYGGGTATSSGADYAEYFEWADGNPRNEDRCGMLVQFSGEKIVPAHGDDIEGIVSAAPSVAGNACETEWHGKYKRDVFGRQILDENGKPVLADDFDSSRKYVPRSQRPEWAAVGIVGRLVITDDGSCKVGGFVSARRGTGTSCFKDTGVKVLRRLDKNHVEVLIR